MTQKIREKHEHHERWEVRWEDEWEEEQEDEWEEEQEGVEEREGVKDEKEINNKTCRIFFERRKEK